MPQPHEPLVSAAVAPRPHSDDPVGSHDPSRGVVDHHHHHPGSTDDDDKDGGGERGRAPPMSSAGGDKDDDDGAAAADLEALAALLEERLAVGDAADAARLLQQQQQQPRRRLASLDLEGVAALIRTGGARRIICMTGAGVSVSAGIPDFRTPGTGLYSQLERFNLPEPEAVFNISFFRKNPKPFHLLARELFPGNYAPTPTHHFISLLWRKGLLLRCFTQNIDSLEREAGLPREAVVAAHGNFDAARCIKCGREVPVARVREAVFADKICHCDKCGGLVKPDIVFFGEALPDAFYERAEADLPRCDLLLVMGTSLVVHPFAGLVDAVGDDVPRVLLNRERVGEGMGGGNGGLMAMLLGRRAGGFVFEEDDGAYRDVLCLGDTDDGVRQLCDLLGWRDELEALVAAGGSGSGSSGSGSSATRLGEGSSSAAAAAGGSSSSSGSGGGGGESSGETQAAAADGGNGGGDGSSAAAGDAAS